MTARKPPLASTAPTARGLMIRVPLDLLPILRAKLDGVALGPLTSEHDALYALAIDALRKGAARATLTRD